MLAYMSYLGALPKPGSFHVGEEPPAPAGGWPAFKGKVGPRQKKCIATGGRWIGPKGRKWCQMTPLAIPAQPRVDLPSPPGYAPSVPGPLPGVVPSPIVPPPIQGPVDNALVPPGERIEEGPAFGPPPGAMVEDGAVMDVAGPQTMYAGDYYVRDRTSYVPWIVAGAVVVGALAFMRQKPKRKKR